MKINNFSKDWLKCINICKRDQISFDFLLFKHKINYLRDTIDNKLLFYYKRKHLDPKNRFIK